MTTNQFIENLFNPSLFPHPIKYFKLIETHSSWVILTGDFVYKIKKPVDFVFLDYSTLEKRKYFCELEYKFNQILASQIYLEVVPITGTIDHPEINGQGKAIEYALKMREFPQDNLLDHLVKQGKLTAKHIDEIAEILADFHNKIDRNSEDYIGTPDQVHEPVVQNFDQIRPLLNDKAEIATINDLQNWAEIQWNKWIDIFKLRKLNQFIRACHGDIHLGNITLINNKPVIFDCIEFNEAIRWTDVMADLAFLLMDLHFRQQKTLANRVLNYYLELTGDYQGLAILPYYLSYRAMVRAKVNLFQLVHSQADSEKQLELKNAYHEFISLAEKYALPSKPFLLITNGFSGSGKSTIARQIVEKFAAIQIRSDVERKRLAGLTRNAKTQSGVYQDLYHPEMSEKVYQHLAELAEFVIKAGYPIIIDATFALRSHRDMFSNLAKRLNVQFAILHCHAPIEELSEFIMMRNGDATEVSEATDEILMAQKNVWQALQEEELKEVFTVDFNQIPQWLEKLAERLAR